MYRFLVDFVLNPWLVLFLATAVGLGNLWWRRVETRRRLWLVTGPFLLLVLIGTPAVAHLAVVSLSWRYPPGAQPLEERGAIVVLGGFVMPPTETRPSARLGWDSLNRCLWAAELYRQGPPSLVVLTGGKMDPDEPGPTISEAMGEFIVRYDVRPEDLLLDRQSRSTYENAVEAKRLLEPRGIRRIVLVTDTIHLRRAELCFRRQGFEVVASGWEEEAADFEWSAASFLPRADAAGQIRRVVHEWVGILYYRATGRI